MAKFSRYDARNKKRDRNKIRSIDKDIKIRHQDVSTRERKRWDESDWINEDDDDYYDEREYV